ncbi:hypothetical protein BLNAU_5531 [Blattamonas nauphoetae]|uniref:PPPDE domain-containing protein n=1 Tax=Blattamonas nauphoetae TaxID=2049346 RepID=A0ABQ9Y6W8_9EUKA|nr:hypothetical protein BLNAU_5531 [Blattamonas nauphoetae]
MPLLANLVSAVHTSVHVHPTEPDALSADIYGLTIEFDPEGIHLIHERYGSYMNRTLQRTGHSRLRSGLSGEDLSDWLVENHQDKYNPHAYKIATRNCQHFALDLYRFLTKEPGAKVLYSFGVLNASAGFVKVLLTLIIFIILPILAVVSVCLQINIPRHLRKKSDAALQKVGEMNVTVAEEGVDDSVVDPGLNTMLGIETLIGTVVDINALSCPISVSSSEEITPSETTPKSDETGSTNEVLSRTESPFPDENQSSDESDYSNERHFSDESPSSANGPEWNDLEFPNEQPCSCESPSSNAYNSMPETPPPILK